MPYPETYPAEAVSPTVTDLSGRPCPRLTGSSEVARRLAELDEQYIRGRFKSLADLSSARDGGLPAVRQAIADGRLPQPAYRLDDGTDMVPPEYFDLVDAAGGIEALPDWFSGRYVSAARERGLPHDEETVAEQWGDYLSGGYFVCLREVTPETLAQKALLITSLESLLAQPAPQDSEWAGRLRAGVEALAAIERTGSPLDPPRWGGPMSPQWYGSYLRSYYPQVFGSSQL